MCHGSKCLIIFLVTREFMVTWYSSNKNSCIGIRHDRMIIELVSEQISSPVVRWWEMKALLLKALLSHSFEALSPYFAWWPQVSIFIPVIHPTNRGRTALSPSPKLSYRVLWREGKGTVGSEMHSRDTWGTLVEEICICCLLAMYWGTKVK